mgnify:FL=1
MRVCIKLVPEQTGQASMVIPLDFRRHFISLMKTFLHDSPIFSHFISRQPGYSPYVFSIGFNKIIAIDVDEGKMNIQPPIYMTISSGFYEVITEIINAAIKMRDKPVILGLKIRRVEMLPMKRTRAPEAEFRICGHAVFRGTEEYLDGSDVQLLEESINQHMINKFLFFHDLPLTMQEEYSLSPVRVLDNSNYRKGVCHHYGGPLTTLQGRMHLQADPKSMQFLYDFGIGVRSGQGFGLLEVVRQI